MVSPCGDFRGDGCELKSSTVHLFGGTSSATMTQVFAVKLNSVKMQMFTCRFEKHNTNKSK